MAAFLVAATLAARPNLCFTAHGKSTLQCTMPLVDGPISVYDDSESPQKARKMFFSGGKLCKERGCKKCMAPGGAWVSCGSKEAKGLTVAVMGANGDAAKPKAIAFAVLLTIIPCAVFYLVGKQRASKPIASGKGSGPAPTGIASSAVEFLLRFAGAPWFPLIAALGTAINMFTIIFTGATVVIFLASVLGARKRWPVASICNAAGATLGTAVLLLLVRERGLEYLNESFPALLGSPAWAKATGLMQTYGVGGMLLVSSMPIILHPVIAFGMLSGMSNAQILGIVMAGRTVKYLVMGWVTANAPGALKYFGIKGALVEYATSATANQR